MKTIGLIFPHQLFQNHPIFEENCDEMYLIEDSLFFGDKHSHLKFHKQKLVLHRASMQAYKDELKGKGISVTYIEYDPEKTIVDILKELKAEKVICVDPTDYLLKRRLKRVVDEKNLTFLDSPLFINSKEDNQEYLKDGKLFMQNFYTWQRKRLDILINEDGKPTGGRWSFDDENRKKVPKSHYPEIPNDPGTRTNDYVTDAIKYVEEKFPDNYGYTKSFSYAINREQALAVLRDFCKERLHLFGDYEDAIVKDKSQLYHSMLSPYLNIGLLLPMEVIESVINYANENDIPINNTEGIIRQIIGWREFIRMVYEEHGVSMRTENQWNHRRHLSDSWYLGTTGIDPVDTTISKTLDTAYAHHIERLMVMGNFMFLCRIKPNHIYNWFMEMYIDAYDWVMVPNIYGMTQSTQKGLMTTKPYISGSNYVKKMSDYSNGPWAKTWDALYWTFIIDHLNELKSNGRMHFVTSRAAKFSTQEKKDYAEIAEEFFRSL
ncbi:MAG: cryptochrome/photolyase family protein [Candidatus Pacebacteria bacterium]|nr:cryptochrome/photolyase family protein [Candidatus Paceibacterota bacterium]